MLTPPPALRSGVALALSAAISLGADAQCGVPGTIAVKTPDGSKVVTAPTRVFPDGSVAVRARLAVNPDGGLHSYTVGDHGFTYIANGLSRWRNGSGTKCDSGCMAEFRAAESAGFGPGTATFCVYAVEVDPFPGGSLVSCGDGRRVVGNGQGQPRRGAQAETVTGATVQTYVSTTSLKHTVNGAAAYLDSESLPVAVTPTAGLLGRLVWVGGTGYQPTVAVLGDVGPAFGEGSIALHQLLRTGQVTPQKTGPIPRERRCGPEEAALRKPFLSRPDAKDDACRRGRTAASSSDIRAYGGVDQAIDFVILGKGAPPLADRVLRDEVTAAGLQDRAQAAGYTPARIQAMLACLPR